MRARRGETVGRTGTTRRAAGKARLWRRRPCVVLLCQLLQHLPALLLRRTWRRRPCGDGADAAADQVLRCNYRSRHGRAGRPNAEPLGPVSTLSAVGIGAVRPVRRRAVRGSRSIAGQHAGLGLCDLHADHAGLYGDQCALRRTDGRDLAQRGHAGIGRRLSHGLLRSRGSGRCHRRDHAGTRTGCG